MDSVNSKVTQLNSEIKKIKEEISSLSDRQGELMAERQDLEDSARYLWEGSYR